MHKGINESRGENNKDYWRQWQKRKYVTKTERSGKIRNIRGAIRRHMTELVDPKIGVKNGDRETDECNFGICDGEKPIIESQDFVQIINENPLAQVSFGN